MNDLAKEINEFRELFDVSLLEQIAWNANQFSDFFQAFELLSHLTCFDLYKLDLVKNLNPLKLLFEKTAEETIEKEKNKKSEISKSFMIKESDLFQMFLAIVHTSLNLCLDKKKEIVEHYKKNYEINDDDFKSFEELQMKYNSDAYKEQVEFLKYDQNAIKTYDIKNFLCREVKISKFVSNFIEKFQKSFSLNTQVSFKKSF